MKKGFLVVAFLIGIINVNAQHSFKAIVKDKATQQPLIGVTVEYGSKTTISKTSIINIGNLAAGKHQFIVSFVGYEPATIDVILPDTTTHNIILTQKEKVLVEVTVASSTRSNQNIENSPLKVEVLGKEEMDEENVIKPGNIASVLNDISGIQIQQSSAVSGNSNVRIQGLDGRYTQILRDGMPLFDGFSGGFGILQIPPLDLKQIELVKGSASTLYGGGAIGGLINLISKRPSFTQEGVITLNQTTLKESNFNTYTSKRNKSIGYNFFGGVTHQVAVDVNGDGLSDVPKTDAIFIHPKVFLYPSQKTTIALGYTGTFETRNGGDIAVINGNKNSVHQFFEKNITNRNTGDILVEHFLGNGKKLEFKASLSSFTRTINTTTHNFKGNQLNYFSELSLFIPKDKNSLVMGINATGDRFKKLASDPILFGNFDNNTIGAFAQYTGKITEKTTLEAGLRADHHFEYGDFVLPRIAVFHRFNQHWATRLGIGLGYKTPNPLVQQNVEYSIENIQPLPTGLSAEKSVGYNIEFNYKKEFDQQTSLFINQAFFLTQINNPVVATLQSNSTVAFANAGSNLTSKGFDTYVKLKLDELELYAGYTFTIAERNYLPQNKFVPLTPKNRFAFVLVEEIENVWRFGLEGSFTGPQYRDGDSKTPSYFFMAALVERKFGKALSVVFNCENLLDYRQSNHEALFTGTITNPTFKPLWAPIDGRVVNLSVKWNWAKKN